MILPQAVQYCIHTLEAAGYQAYAVGGCVRDSLLGLSPADYDLCTDAKPEETSRVFSSHQLLHHGQKHGTVGVVLDGQVFEITTFRTEGGYGDARHPDWVEFVPNVEEDLARRDFTINAMAYNPKTGYVDPFGGRQDLQNGILRTVGDPEARFREDALRILRGLRFCARFGFVPEQMTDAAMRAGAFRLEMISAERVFTELMGMLMGEHVTEILVQYPRVLAVRMPEILPCIGFCQHTRHHDFNVWGHIARAVGCAPKIPAVRLAMLMHDLGKPATFTRDARGGHFEGHAEKSAEIADKILLRLRCENHLRELVVKLIRLHREIPARLSDVQRLLGELEYVEFSLFLDVLRADNASKFRCGEDERAAAKIAAAQAFAEQCKAEQLCCRVSDLQVRGGDLLALGLHGAQIGEALRFLLDAVIEQNCPNEKYYLLEYFRKNSKKLAI